MMNIKTLINQCAALAISAVVIISSIPTVDASGARLLEPRFRHGNILGRGIVTTEAGHKIISEYAPVSDKDIVGEIVADVISGPKVDDYKILSAAQYNVYVAYYKKFLVEHKQGLAIGAQVISDIEYNNKEFKTRDCQGDPESEAYKKYCKTVDKTPLLPGTKSILIPAQTNLLLASSVTALVQAPFKLNEDLLSDSLRSVLIDELGNKIHQTQNNLGLKTDFYKGYQEGQEYKRRTGVPYAPIKHKVVSVVGPVVDGHGVSDQNGKWVANYFTSPCPGFSYFIENPSTMRLDFTRFDPKLKSPINSIYMMFPGYDSCSNYAALLDGATTLSGQMAQAAIIAIESQTVTNVLEEVYFLDMGMISAEGQVTSDGTNILPLGETKYEYTPPADQDKKITQTKYDFDGDDKEDTAILGKWVKETKDGVEYDKFKADADGEFQGIYLSSGSQDIGSDDPDIQVPDFVRVSDRLTDFQDQGLLESISKTHLQETDVYVFREYNGRLIAERQDMKQEEMGTYSDGDVGSRDRPDEARIFFNVFLRGPLSSYYDTFGIFRGDSDNKFAPFQSKYMADEELHQVNADHLRPDEMVRVVVINRKTGYMGSVRIEYGKLQFTKTLPDAVRNIVLRPPNLKVKVERGYKVEQGLTKGDDREYTVGYEGASMTSDNMLKVTTEWFDHDGTPLPVDLADYGFTGRLAKVTSDQTIGEQGEIKHFSIKPGKQIQLLDFDLGKNSEHFYVQVSGESIENADFAEPGDGEGPLSKRPEYYVPFKVPLLDETMTWEQYRIYRRLKEENPEEFKNRPEPIYKWHYRPEMQFSMYHLMVDQILRTDFDGTEVDIFKDEIPGLASSDQLVKLMYKLAEHAYKPLPYLGTGQELVFALGEEEVKLDVDDKGQIKFENIEHLSSLTPEDYLSLKLYSNNDAANVLWEYAFEYLVVYAVDDIDRNSGDDVLYLSADKPEIDLGARLQGYVYRSDEIKESVEIRWVVDGEGMMKNKVQVDDEIGVFINTLTMPTKSGSKASVKVQLKGQPNVSAKFMDVIIYAGNPHNINIEATGRSYVQGIGETKFIATVTDRYGNRVNDGTAVSFRINGSSKIKRERGITKGGVAEVTIVGGMFSETSNTLTVTSGDATDNYVFSVDTITPTLTFKSQSSINSSNRLAIEIGTESSSSLIAEGVNIDYACENCDLSLDNLKTDSEGIVRGILTLPDDELSSSLRISVDYNSPVLFNLDSYKQSHSNIAQLSSDSGSATNKPILIVGDSTSSSPFITSTYNNNSVTAYLRTADSIHIHGEKNKSWHLGMRSFEAPNREPLINFNFDKRIVDTINSIKSESEEIQFKNSDNQFNEFVAEFTTKSKFKFDVERVKLPNKPLVNISLKSSGTGVFSLFDSALEILLNDESKVFLAINESENQELHYIGTVEENHWQSIGVLVDDNEIKVSLNDEVKLIELSSESRRAIFKRGVYQFELSQYSGEVAQIALYDWDSLPLIEFEGSEFELDGVFGDNSQPIVIKSTGNMTKAKSTIVKVDMNSDKAYFVNLHKLDSLLKFSSTFAEINNKDEIHAADIQRYFPVKKTNVSPKAISKKLIESVSVPMNGNGGTVETLKTSLINEINTALSFASDACGVDFTSGRLSLLKQHFAQQNNIAYLKYTKDTLINGFKLTNNVDESVFCNLSLAITVLGELIEIRPDYANLVAKSIQNKGDLINWYILFAMPAEGWIGSAPPLVSVDQTCENAPKSTFGVSPIPIRLCRLSGDRVAAVIGAAIEGDEDYFYQNPKELSSFARGVNRLLVTSTPDLRILLFAEEKSRDIGALDLLPVHKAHAVANFILQALAKKVLKFLSKQGFYQLKLIQKFAGGHTSLRTGASQALIIMAIAAIHTSEECKESNECTTFNEAAAGEFDNHDLEARINTLLKIIGHGIVNPRYFTIKNIDDSEIKTMCFTMPTVQGANFELTLATYFFLKNKINSSSPKLIGLDFPHKVHFWWESGSEGLVKRYETGNDYIQRRPDIILGTSNEQIWVEAKSTQAYTADPSKVTVKERGFDKSGEPKKALEEKIKGPWKIWDAVKNNGTSNHRQFYLDWLSNTKPPKISNNIEKEESGYYEDMSIVRQRNVKHYWYIHSWKERFDDKVKIKHKGKTDTFIVDTGVSFKRKNIKGVDDGNADFDFLRKHIATLPSGSVKGKISTSVNVKSRNSFEANETLQTDLQSRIKSFNFATELLNDAELSKKMDVPDDFKEWLKILSEYDVDNMKKMIDELPGLPDIPLPYEDEIQEWVDEYIDGIKDINLVECPNE
jgi:hypothetical protein